MAGRNEKSIAPVVYAKIAIVLASSAIFLPSSVNLKRLNFLLLLFCG
jgi:hypothetical protein